MCIIISGDALMIKSVEKCMKIMTIISNGRNKPVSLTKIADISGLPKPTCMHIISTLLNDGFVEKISHSEGYILGPSSYYLTRFGTYNQGFVTVCRPVSRWLYKQVNQPIVLSVIQGNKKYIIDRIPSDYYAAANEDIISDDIYRTATGRCILANMSDSDVERIWSLYGPPKERDALPNINTFEELKKQLKKYKTLNYISTETNERSCKLYGYAIPIFEHYECIGALGVAARCDYSNTENFKKVEEPKIIAALTRATREINRRLRYNA